MTPVPFDPAMPPPSPNLVIKTRDGSEDLASAENSGEFRRNVEILQDTDRFVSIVTAGSRLRTYIRARDIVFLQENFDGPPDYAFIPSPHIP